MVVGVSRLGAGEKVVSPVFGNSSLAGNVGGAVVSDGARDVGGGVLRDGAATSVKESSGNELETWALDAVGVIVGWSLACREWRRRGRWRRCRSRYRGTVKVRRGILVVDCVVDCVGDDVGSNVGVGRSVEGAVPDGVGDCVGDGVGGSVGFGVGGGVDDSDGGSVVGSVGNDVG